VKVIKCNRVANFRESGTCIVGIILHDSKKMQLNIAKGGTSLVSLFFMIKVAAK
jgi:hypothetical protein